MTASRYEASDLGSTKVVDSYGQISVGVPQAVFSRLHVESGDELVYLEDSDDTALVFSHESVPDDPSDVLGTRTVYPNGEQYYISRVPADAIEHLGLAAGERAVFEQGPGGSVLVRPCEPDEYTKVSSTDTDTDGSPNRDELAELHLASRNGGHWWEYFDQAEPPDHYMYQDEEVRGRDQVPPEHQPDVPADPDWSEYVDYICRRQQCQDNCINRADSPYAQTKMCRACYPKA